MPSKTVKKTSTKKTEQAVEETQPLSVVEETVVQQTSEPVVEETTQQESSTSAVEETTQVSQDSVLEESNTEVLFNKLIAQFQDVQLVMKTLHSNLKVLQKEVLKEKKENKKKSVKMSKKKSDKKRSPSGFAKPALVTDDLASFMGVPPGTQLARTDVTSNVIAYVMKEKLQNPDNKKEIIPDDKLRSLLNPKEEDKITFFNLQTYLKHHFIPTVSVPLVVDAPVVV
jgi:chromatin remodeling complex protein RSC6